MKVRVMFRVHCLSRREKTSRKAEKLNAHITTLLRGRSRRVLADTTPGNGHVCPRNTARLQRSSLTSKAASEGRVPAELE